MEHITTDQFNILYRDSYKQLFSYAYGFMDDAETCRDILSSVFEKLWSNRKRISPDTARSYLYQCVRNECIDHARRQHISQEYVGYVKAAAYADNGIEPEEVDERLAAMRATISQMPERTRYVLEQCYFENKKYSEVAEQLDLSSSAIKKHIMKALAMLRGKLGGEGTDIVNKK